MQLQVQGEGAAAVDVADRVFAHEYNEPLIHQVVTSFLAGARSGTRAQKNRSAVSGGGTKPWRQKGTGRARSGTSRSPLWRGGGVAFAASSRDFSQKVNRKMYRAAMRSILSQLVREERLVVVEDFTLEAPKTRDLAKRLAQLGLKDVAIVSHEVDANLYLASRNIPKVVVSDVAAMDPVLLVQSDKTLMTVAAMRQIEEWLG
jgi:large subunit ribosomal protein L4